MSDNKQKGKYRLYAMLGGDMPSDAEFYFLLPDIDLVYTQVQPQSGIEIKDPQQIPAAAREWLAETIDEIAARYLKENEDTLLAGSKTFLDRFRVELESEMEKSEKTPIRVKARVRKNEHG